MVVGLSSLFGALRSSVPTASAATKVSTQALSSATKALASGKWYDPLDAFIPRHIGPTDADIQEMVEICGRKDLEDFATNCIPESIRIDKPVDFPAAMTETEMAARLNHLANQNKVLRSYIGTGYYNTITPAAIRRNVLQNPGWYTPYTPYQAEVAQGRMESLLNYQTMIQDLTQLPIANASLLDEATAGAEAMTMCAVSYGKKCDRVSFYVDDRTHPQVIALIKSRAKYSAVDVIVAPRAEFDFTTENLCGVLVQYPDTTGSVNDLQETISAAKDVGALVAMGTDLLALTVLKAPGELGADIAYGNSQRFGVPLGYGGPHAAFYACKEELLRKLPGRLVGVTKDAQGDHAFRLSLQTRENQIKRDKATSNICTAQALLANVAAMYALYHGPEGLKAIATRVHALTVTLANGLEQLGHQVNNDAFFDTIKITPNGITSDEIRDKSVASGMNFRHFSDGDVGVSFDETVSIRDVYDVLSVFGYSKSVSEFTAEVAHVPASRLDGFERQSEYMTHPIFHAIKSETDLMRYCKRLENKDISLTHSMIPLGSCTMKLNAASEMEAITDRRFADLHPHAPLDQAQGYHTLAKELMDDLCAMTGYDAVSLQPNSGAQGELAGMYAIRRYHESRGDSNRNICLIPNSAHGTNPASAVMAGMKVAKVKNLATGYIDMDHLKAQCEKHKDNLAAIMVTYPSTYGVFEENIREICDLVHAYGGQVYLDGANMNAQMMLARPGDYGADVSHFNLHKTFCIPHGGGGPGMGPIGVKKQLIPFLPGYVYDKENQDGQVSASNLGSALILPISWAYIRMAGAEGLKRSSQVAILNANYMVQKLKDHYQIAYTSSNNTVAHEFIIDMKPFKKHGVQCMDVAKRLQDYGYHSATVSWPVNDSLMIEPTESESKEELDRFVKTLIMIKEEVQEIADGKYSRDDNVIVNAPHSAKVVLTGEWTRPYSREKAAYPGPWQVHAPKTWPGCGRVDDVYGDRNIVCSCPPMDLYDE